MIKKLIKIQFATTFGSLSAKSRGGKVKKASILKILGITLVLLYVVGIFAFIITEAAITMGKALIPSGLSWLYFAVFTLLSLSVIFIFGIFETKSVLFECKDNELLLSMPIKPGDIVASRVFTVLVYSYIEQLLIMTPVIVVYGVMSGDAVGVFGSILLSLFIPIIATSLATGVGYLIALLAKKIGKNSFFVVGLAILFMLAYFWVYNVVLENFESFIAGLEGVGASKPPILFYIGAASLFHAVSTPVIIAIALAAAFITYFIVAKSYIRIVSDNYTARRSVYRKSDYSSKSALSALVSKELKAYFSSANYMLNCTLGVLLEVILAVVAIIKRDDLLNVAAVISTELGVSSPENLLAPIMLAAVISLSVINTVSACALSLEGKRFWIMKSMPISDRDALLSKMLPHVILTLLSTLICSVAFIIASSAPIEQWVFFIIAPFMANAFMAIFGVIMNVLFPKFEYTNEAQAIKQSMSMFVTVMTGMLVASVALIGSLFLLSIWSPILVSAFLFGVFFLLSAVMYFILMGPVRKKYRRLSAL